MRLASGWWSGAVKRRRDRTQRIPILTYHAAHADGADYAGNDHLALEADLATIRQSRFRVVPLRAVVDFVTGRRADLADGRFVALTFDDAPDFDWYDYVHASVGCIKSFYRLLVESGERDGAMPTAVSFAIAGDEAREAIDRACLAGRGHWRSHWWAEAARSGVLGIANHSFDHAHPAVPHIRQREQRKGTFHGIDNREDADAQIAAAQRLLWFRTGGEALPYFAYPYGDAPAYLTHEYFPTFGPGAGLDAAFGTQGEYATRAADRWHIPRFVCGQHWRSPEELAAILGHASVH